MSDEEPLLPVRGKSDDKDLLLYDFFKHLTSLALFTLGGVLILAQSADREDVKPALLIAVLVIISASGVLAFSGTSEITRARYTGTPPYRSLDLLRKAAPAMLALGVGMFLSMFVDSLN
jgi:hypothetical protein